MWLPGWGVPLRGGLIPPHRPRAARPAWSSRGAAEAHFLAALSYCLSDRREVPHFLRHHLLRGRRGPPLSARAAPKREQLTAQPKMKRSKMMAAVAAAALEFCIDQRSFCRSSPKRLSRERTPC